MQDEQSTRHVSRMQQIVLQWDYFKLTNKGTPKRKLRSVPEKFESMEDYMSVFEPLVLEECCAQLTRGESQDDFSSVPHGAVVMDFEKAHNFHFTSFGLEMGKCKNYHENDLVLVSKLKP
eukprot:CAMPEP_0198225894 /NCGR_PEP_ID=MMETSP1445-20131203/102956_1 /TAXON_ID=36898 /ORGANISM="Pyramimonas sp., Strain CCMP2087" /LENGTH=119 /DNA_ID=CAMNT_0043905561 /DNA_START=201 /DNA_END=557 /DNA_ORIENTATION=-